MSIKRGESILKVRDLKTYYPIHGVKKRYVHAVDSVSFDLNSQETLGLVGESGCGKSTLARSIMRIEEIHDGNIVFQGADITHMSKRELRTIRKDMQIIFQDPYSSLNPRMCIGDIVEEPLLVHGVSSATKRREMAKKMIERVGLSPDYVYRRYPHEFSGGQRQRICIARSLILMPSLLICDEAVSALDVSIQSQILNLLIQLQKEMKLTYIFISHAMNVIRHISHRVGVMYLGKIVELADTDELFNAPSHPYTIALLSAIPAPDPSDRERDHIPLEGELPSPQNPPTGCRFHTRCPYVMEKCKTEDPSFSEIKPGHFCACHLRQ
ncbi:MAG TPA: ATP-binding cassette domain-containing protein [Clostridiaceae bacterium]|jgi:oligopeptide transport system ATP-binding protein|nr:ATP-binding cassette domain-containing protein [Clostridiaceae bacterium]